MSFAKEVKEELSKIRASKCCSEAELSALLHMNAGISFSREGNSVEFSTTNPTIAKRFVEILKSLYEYEIELLAMQNQSLKKNTTYLVKVSKANELIDKYQLFSLNPYEDFDNVCCKRAYLRGAFLVFGSINDPAKSYHLEIKCRQNKDAVFIQRLMNENDLNAKIGKRRNELIVYLKEAQKIADFINLVGATKMYFKYEDVRMMRSFTNNINRSLNCELANADKSLASALSQINDIETIKSKDIKLDEKILEIVDLRIKYDTATLNELVNMFELEYGYKISKSGLNHRFRKIREIADEIRNK